MTITSIDIDPELLSEAKRLLSASSNREAVERALRYTVSKERQLLAFERISTRAFTDEQLAAEKIDYSR
jgi:Arc/MetJ family transcription regulator